MRIATADPYTQTILFGIVCFVLILCTTKLKWKHTLFAPDDTTEMRGFAMLAIVISHIGYFLSLDSQFLFPFSIGAGVAVNVFFFLSGFGLTISALKKELTPLRFYKERILKIGIPVWISLVVLYILDFILLAKTYSYKSILQSFLIWFPSADIWNSINSPLWYLTFLLLFYIAFPLLFNKKAPYVSAFLILLWGLVLARFAPVGVLELWRTHSLIFSLGVFSALLLHSQKEYSLFTKLTRYVFNSKMLRVCIGVITLVVFLFGVRFYAGVGTAHEQYMSIVLLLLFFVAFSLLPIRSNAISIIGKCSFGIYLFHWPLMYRYGFWFPFMPAWVGSIVGIALSLLLAIILEKFIRLAKFGKVC